MFYSLAVYIECNLDAKYTVNDELSGISTIGSSDWIDMKTNEQLSLCLKNDKLVSVGRQQSTSDIYWEKTYTLPDTLRVYVYIEYQVSGNWDNKLDLYVNGIKTYSKTITLTDTNRLCSDTFLYNDYIYSQMTITSNTLKLTIKSDGTGQGLYIQNIVIDQLTQSGRDVILSNFFDSIPDCPSGLQFSQYYCKCPLGTYLQENVCVTTCAANYLFINTIDQVECVKKQYCDTCVGLTGSFQCNTGYYKISWYDITGVLQSDCVDQCPRNYILVDRTSYKECIHFQSYLTEFQNKNNVVDHYSFYQSTPNFLHFLTQLSIKIEISSLPQNKNERPFFFFNNKFYIGTYERFQFQQIALTTLIGNSQYQARVTGIAHFIDFEPTTFAAYINKEEIAGLEVKPATQNEGTALQDYICEFDLTWTTPVKRHIYNNFISFAIEQPLQDGQYKGYFYIEDVQIYQLNCRAVCQACLDLISCDNCTNPAHKDPDRCNCESGYFLSDSDICYLCPSYCAACQTADNVCTSCLASTHRVGTPKCITCASNYYLVANDDNCHQCINHCDKCSNNTECQVCLTGYFLHQTAICVELCDPGYFNDNSDPANPICSICDLNCKECKDLATKCTVCKENFMLVANACYKCDDGTYLSGTTCLPCPAHCQLCNPSTCTQCEDSYFYHAGKNQCITTCDSNQFPNTETRTCDACAATCSTCQQATSKDCLSCPLGLYLNLITSVAGECSPNCSPGFYPSGVNCAKCWVGCKTCADNTQKCLICAPLYYRDRINDNKCVTQCPDGYYNNNKGYICSSCDPSCKTCSGPLTSNCNSCVLPLGLYQYQCLESCPKGYGNLNAVCEQCTANCDSCFGKAPNQCATCSSGFYFLRNQCYGKCPKNYIGVRPQYICKCVFENCISCTDTQFNYDNKCYDICPAGTFGFNGMCIKCDITCSSCFGEEYDQCSTCVSPLVLFEGQCLLECKESTYLDIPKNECFYCDETCLVCDGPTSNDCTACKGKQLLSTDGSCVDLCPEGSYVVLAEMKCYACHTTCKTCFGSANNNCIICPTGSLFYLNQCVDSCPDGFKLSGSGLACEPNFELKITKCAYQCSTCQFTERFCTGCSGNRMQNFPFCECDQGFYDDGANPNCLTCANKCLSCKQNADKCILCKGNRYLPNCSCPDYYYDDGTSVQCIKCQDNCSTCNASGCLTCLHDRINSPDCICPAGYYEAFQPYCQTCQEQCSTCAEADSLCLTCAVDRIDPPVCNCPPGFYSTKDKKCQKCNATCASCLVDDCLSCSGNRQGPVLGQCLCVSPGVSRMTIGSVYCTDCDTGVPYFGLIEDFTGFFIDFGAMVELMNKVDEPICEVIFDPETLSLLGKDPVCGTDLTVIFGEDPTIKVGDEIKLNKKFKLLGCDSPFSSIFPMPLSIPPTIDQDSHKPLIVFNDLTDKNICTPIKIEFVDKKFNGRQTLNIIDWSIIVPNNPNPQILEILQQNQANNSEIIRFPEQVFTADIKYKFQITVESFALLQNVILVEFTPIVRFEASLQIDTAKSQYYRYEQIKIPFQLTYSNCIEQSQPPDFVSYSIQLQFNNTVLLTEKITNGLTKTFVKDVEVSIDPYYFNLSNPHTFIYSSKLVRVDYSMLKSNNFDLYILSSDPKVSIGGSSKMIGYEDKLDLQATISDLDYSPKEAESLSYVCIWECLNIASGQACTDVSDLLIEFNNTCNLTLQPKTLAPYNVFEFAASIFKNEKQYTGKVNIQTMEVNLPELDVSPISQDTLYNYYDETILQLSYPGINPDLLMYAGAVIYDSIAVTSFEFYYLDFKFKLQDYFTDLTFVKGNNIRLRLSIYDPHFVMPSISTVIFPMNIPPIGCELQYDKSMQIEFLDRLNINVINCYDSDSPLTYQVYLYANSTIYKHDLVRARFYHNLLLIPPSEKQSFNISLPYYNSEPNLLVVEIKDNIGGISNITTSIPVRSYKEISEETFVNYLNIQNGLDQQLIAYRVVVERLSILDGLLDYKEKLFKQLIQLDQNQSYLSNQTECIYHSISTIVGQNCSLLQFNQTEFLKQLNYRINQTAQELIHLSNLQLSNQLTSELNIQKNNYIQQYCSFANILSQFVKYRVQVNTTATEIQSSLNVIMDYLQSISIPNEPLFTIQSNSANMNFGYLTSKMVQSVTSTSLKSEENQSSDNSTSTNFYKFSQTRFIDNPFYSTKGFPKNSSGYQAVDPKIQSTSSNHTNNSLSSPMSFAFPDIKKPAENSTQKCVTQVNSEEWSADICKSVKKDGQVICQCETLNPTSIMESLDLILDKAQEIFSPNALAAFLTFPFYKAVIFYFYLTITIGYLYIIYWGLKADTLMFERIQVEKDLEEKKQILEEKEQEELEQNQQHQQKPPTIFSKNKVYPEDQFVQPQQVSQNVQKVVIETKQENHNQQVDQQGSKGNLEKSHQQEITSLFNHQNQPLTQETKEVKKKSYVFPDFLKHFHQILSIIYKDDDKKPRGLRATIIYTSIMGSLVVLFVFNQPNNLSFTMALALITAPLNKIYQVALEKLLSHKRKSVRVVGAVVMVVIAAFISYTMLAGLALNGDIETSNRWSYIFLGSLTLDNIVYSPIQLIIQYNIHIGRINIPILQQLLAKLLDEQAKKYIQEMIEKVK